ncbi:hypothetical protein [Candidatus Williamhamiltonella defendens]|nr:hypothetical protein [Candidatus Hamiltonella defensa]
MIISLNVKKEDMNWLKPGITVNATMVVTGKHEIMSYLVLPFKK